MNYGGIDVIVWRPLSHIKGIIDVCVQLKIELFASLKWVIMLFIYQPFICIPICNLRTLKSFKLDSASSSSFLLSEFVCMSSW